MTTETDTIVAEQTKVKYPSRYNVIMHNNDSTPMDFVITVLVEVFKHDSKKAYDLMMSIHNNGAAVVGNFTRDVAETKVDISLKASQHEGFNEFRVTAEPE